MVIKVPDASIVATPVLLLLYVIAPPLLLVGNVVAPNAASPYVFVSGTENVPESVGETVSVLLVLVALAYCAVAACVAVNVTLPALKSVIQSPDASMVATPVLLLLYVIAPLLSLVGRSVILNDASPYILELETVNVPSDGIVPTVNAELTLLVT
jgi:hypothetical protein